jgi:nucleotide-binding universal stress UspA family protein
VVVGVGESSAGAAALVWAHDLCRRRGWLLDVVTAWPDLGEEMVREVPGHYNEPRGRAVDALRAALAACGAEIDGTTVQVHVENADPVDALVAWARAANLLVLGASGPGRSRRAGRPSISDLCRAQLTCPVVIVDDDEDATPQRMARARGQATVMPGSR